MTILKRSPDSRLAKGTWTGGQTPEGRTALAACPDCGQIASLSGHTIGTDGAVTPSLVCPADGCRFHDYVKLESWK